MKSSVILILSLICTILTGQEDEMVQDLKLSEYHPVSTYEIKETEVLAAKFPAIDFHSHPYPSSSAEIDSWVQTMDEVGVSQTVLMTYATGTRFDSLYDLYSGYGDRFIIFCGIDYTGYESPDWSARAIAELERCVAKGAKGVGELGDKGKGLFYSKPTPAYGMHIDDPRMAPVLKKCGELKIPVSIHVAEPIWMYLPMDGSNDGMVNAFKWRLDNQPGIKTHDEMIQTLENAVRSHPKTIFIACHYANCSYDVNKLGQLFDRYSNLYADIGARFGETASIPRTMHTFFKKYQNRLLYGTDMGTEPYMYQATFRILETHDEHFYSSISNYHWPLHAYGLPSSILKKVYSKNALRILNGKK